MEPYSLFTRIDRNGDGFIAPMELLHFLRDNNVHDMTEADCYYIVKFFDADEDGRLHTQINPEDFLTLDVERDLTSLLVGEIELHRTSEKIK